MKNFAIALATIMATSTVASAAPAITNIPGNIFVRADVNNDGVLNKGELKRAKKIQQRRVLLD